MKVLVLGAKSNLLLYGIRPALESHHSKELEYPYLEAIIHKHYAHEYSHIDSLWSQLDSASESAKHDYLLLIAQKLQDSVTDAEKGLWSRRYTQVSVQIYDKPERNTVGDLAQSEYEFFEKSYLADPEKMQFLVPLLEQYARLATNAPLRSQNLEASYANILCALSDYLDQKYGEVLHGFDDWR